MSNVLAALNASYQERLDALADRITVKRLVTALRDSTHYRLKYPLAIVAYDGATRLTLPVDPRHYQSAVFRVAKHPLGDQGTTHRDAVFGYRLPGELRRIGVIRYMQLDDDGAVIDVGFDSLELQQEFLRHLHGRTLDAEEQERLVAIQEGVFEHLRAIPELQTALQEFATSREWPTGVTDEARLAYLDAKIADLPAWAQDHGYTDQDMWLAGWYDMSFRTSGEPVFSVRDTRVIRIPYFRNGRIETWRTRNLRASQVQSHKYTSWPLNRSIDNWQQLEHKLYGSWHLGEVEGKPLIITEGEFKCLIAAREGVATVGIPGITEVDESVIKALVEAKASEYIIVLDRDPIGKAWMRVDGITDSQRAAYLIAIRLQEAGAHHVRIGHIPDVRHGEKVGLDDLILDQGAGALPELLKHAMSPSDYARHLGINVVFCRLIRVRQQLRKALEHYDTSVSRGGPQVTTKLYEEACELRDAIQELYASYLTDYYMGARRLDQPKNSLVAYFRQTRGVPDPEQKLILTKYGEQLGLDLFADDIIGMTFLPQNADTEKLFLLGAPQWLPLTTIDLENLKYGRRGAKTRFANMMTLGATALGLDIDDAGAGRLSLHDLAVVAMASKLDYLFPPDEYHLEHNVTFYIRHEDYWEEMVRIPIVVFRKSTGVAVATADVPVWDRISKRDKAMDAVTQARTRTAWFLRHRSSDDDQERYRRVADTLWPYWFERNRESTVEALSRLGITAQTVDQQQLILLAAADARELLTHFMHRRLINQSAQAGLFRRQPDGTVVQRFQGDFVLIPVHDESGTVRALRVLLYELADHLPPALAPQPRIVRHLYGQGKYLIRQFDPHQYIYLQDSPTTPGQPLLVTYHELDALALLPGDTSVVALNSSLELDDRAVQRLAASLPSIVCIVASGGFPASRYDYFSYDGAPGFLKEIYDLTQKIQTALPPEATAPDFRIVATSTPLTQTVAVQGAGSCSQQLLESAIRLRDYLRHIGFNAAQHDMVQRFLRISWRLMDYLELLALPDLLDTRPIDWWVRESKRLYRAIQIYAQSKHGITLPPVEEYFRRLLKLSALDSLEELVRLRQEEGRTFQRRTVYSHDSSVSHELPTEFTAVFEGIMRPMTSNEPIVNRLSLPHQVVSNQTERGTMSTSAKSIVLEHLAQRLKVTPRQEPHFEQLADGFHCRVSINLDGHTYVGSGTAGRKKEAEAEAYRDVLSQMVSAGISVAGAERIELTAPADIPTDVSKALSQLQMVAGDHNYIGALGRFVQTARLQPAAYDTEPLESTGGLQWKTVCRLKLSDETWLTSEPQTDSSKKHSQHKAASDLIARLWKHYESS